VLAVRGDERSGRGLLDQRVEVIGLEQAQVKPRDGGEDLAL
jgi:hypothetical protein